MGLKRVSWVRRYQGQCRALRPLGHQGYRLRRHNKDQPLCSGYRLQPHPHAARLLRWLLWGQQYRHSNPQCEGGMPGSFEVREDMGEDRLRAVEEWLRAEGYEYRFRHKRWRTWTRPDRPGEGPRPDGIEEDEKPNEYPSGALINVSMWDMIEKNFPEPGSERRLQGSSSSASPGKEQRSAGDRKRDRKWRE